MRQICWEIDDGVCREPHRSRLHYTVDGKVTICGFEINDRPEADPALAKGPCRSCNMKMEKWEREHDKAVLDSKLPRSFPLGDRWAKDDPVHF